MLTPGQALQKFEFRLRRLLNAANDILDIGTSRRFAKELLSYENLFHKKNYIAAGYHPLFNYGVYNCNCHQDIQCMTFDDASFDAVICLEVLEHVRDPFQAVKEIKRVMRGGGLLLLTVPFLAQYHGKSGASHSHEEYPDYWRFTHQGLQLLFDNFQELEVLPLDGPIEFRLKQLYLTRWINFRPIRYLIDKLDRPRLGKSTTRHLVFGRK